jgi:transposase
VTAPEQLREHLRGLGLSALVHTCARFRPGSALADPAVATKAALRSLARRYEMLTAEITDADKASAS